MVTQKDQTATVSRMDAPRRTHKLRFPKQLAGVVNAEGESIGNMDARYGVPAPLGVLALSQHDVGLIVDGCEDFAVLEDEKGNRHCERWTALHIQCSGPADGMIGHTRDHLHEGDPMYVASIHVECLRDRLDDLVSQCKAATDFVSENDLDHAYQAVFDALGTAVDKLLEASSLLRDDWISGLLNDVEVEL